MSRLRISLSLVAGLVMTGCVLSNDKKGENCQEIANRYARGFKLKRCSGILVIEVKGGDSYRLSNQEVRSKKGSQAESITLPVSRVVCTSTTQLPWFTALDVPSAVVGFSYPERIYDQELRTPGRIQSVSRAGGIDEEKIFILKPQVILADQGVNISSRLRARIPVIRTSEFSEKHPLGRAEWIRVAGALTGRLPEADSIFLAVEANYLRLAQHDSTLNAPTVLTGIPYGGTWYLPGSESFMAQLFLDAGYRYEFAAYTGVTVPAGLEAVVSRSPSPVYWIGVGHWTSVKEAFDSDRRLSVIRALQLGNLYSYDAAALPGGGNAYFEEAVIRPDLLLQDLINIRRARTQDLRYYRRLPGP